MVTHSRLKFYDENCVNQVAISRQDQHHIGEKIKVDSFNIMIEGKCSLIYLKSFTFRHKTRVES